MWSVLWVGGNAGIATATPESFNENGSTDSVVVLAVLLVLSAALSILAGYVTATTSRSQGLVQVAIAGAILLAIGIFVQMQYWDVMPVWYHLIFLALLLPVVLAGGKLRLAKAC